MEDIEQLLKTLGDRVGKTETKRLRDGQDELRGRYEAVNTQSSDRLKTLTQGIEDLQKFEVHMNVFTVGCPNIYLSCIYIDTCITIYSGPHFYFFTIQDYAIHIEVSRYLSANKAKYM